MLIKLTLSNWKSYDSATLHLDPLTVIIGTNAGGKSNALDALDFLNRSARGINLTSCLSGDGTISPIRGGIEWASRNQSGTFRVGVVARKDEFTEYEYLLEGVIVETRCEIAYEELVRKKYIKKKDNTRKVVGEIRLFKTDPTTADDPTLKARLYNEKAGSVRQLSRASSVLSQLLNQTTRQEISEGLNLVGAALRSVFILDPIPSHMRDYSQLSDTLEHDAGNVAGVVAALPEDRQKEIENVFRKYLSRLPEREIKRVFSERVGRFQSDAMLYCEEKWSASDVSPIIDARGMSDGTLRFIGILAALLTRPSESLLVIEEVDNGLHPSRASLLLEMLQKIGDERRVDILITTHNPALLDAMGPALIPFITVAHRSKENGNSCLTLLENIDDLARILAQGSIGALSSRGVIERALKGEQLTFGF